MTPEEKVHAKVCEYISRHYPETRYESSADGLRLAIGIRQKFAKLRSNHIHLDLFIHEPRGGYAGLIIEIKKKDIRKKDGSLKSRKKKRKIGVEFREFDEHQLQFEAIEHYRRVGYAAAFGMGYEDSVKLIDWYMGLERQRNVKTFPWKYCISESNK